MSSPADAAPGGPLVWRFPRWGALCGVLFVLLMLGGFAGIVGVLLLFGMAIVAAPFLLIGAGNAGPVIAVSAQVLLVVFFLGRQAWRVLRADTQTARDRALNWLVLSVLIVASLVLSVAILAHEWPNG
jgi:hypothetical protein